MTNGELAILSLIVERPHYGYEIEDVIEERGMRNWAEIGFSSIYYLLKKLESAGFIESHFEEKAGRGPGRRVYSLTPQGSEAWREASLAALSILQPCYSSFQLGLANMPGLDFTDVMQALKKYREGLIERQEQVQARRFQEPLPPQVEAMFDLSLTLIQAELDWLGRYIEKLAVQRNQP